eukprot:s1863_g1.t1
MRSSDRYGERSERYGERGYERVYSPPERPREYEREQHRSNEARRSRSRRPEFTAPPVREALPRRRRAPVPTETADSEAAPGTTAAPKVKPVRKSKWDDRGEGDGGGANAVPDWVKDLEPRPVATPLVPAPNDSHAGGQMVSRDSLRRKTMRLKSVQIRVLLGRGGENIKQICGVPSDPPLAWWDGLRDHNKSTR